MLSLRLNILAKLGLALILTIFVSLWVSAQSDCGEEICLSLPAITAGNVIDEQYFHGEISVQSSYEEFLGVDKVASYSLDGGLSWNAVDVKHSYKPVLPAGARYPSAAINPDGSFIVVWQEGATNEPQKIYAQRITAAGSAYGSKFLVNTTTSYDGRLYRTVGFPRVTNQPNGEFVVTWQERGVSALIFTASLVSKRFNKRHEEIGEPVFLSRGVFGGGLSASYHDTAKLANGDLVAVWEGYNIPLPVEGQTKNIFFASIASDGSLIRGDWQKNIVNTHMDNMQVNPRVAALDDGGFVIVWQSLDQDKAGWGVYSQRYDSAGQRVEAETRVNIDGNYNEAFPSVTALMGGGYAIAWEQRTGFLFFTSTHTYTQIYNANGNRIGLPFIVHEETGISAFSGSQSRPVLYGLPNEEIAVGWRQEGQGLVFKRFKHDGSAVDATPFNPHVVPLILLFNEDWGVLFANANFPITPSGNIWPHADHGFVYTDNISSIVSVPGKKQLIANNLSPTNGIDVQFKVEDTTTGQQWYSPIRSYLYADPDSGQLGSITYTDGYSNESSTTVTIDMNCNSCQGLQLFERSAVLSDDQCEAFGEWAPYGASSTLNTQVLVAIEDARCYQYKATVTNLLGNSFDYTSTNILKVDQTAPIITVNSETLNWDQLELDVQVSDVVTGIFSSEYTLNNTAAIIFTSAVLNTTVEDGVNRFVFTAVDKAGNTAIYNHFVTADLTPPEIVIHSIEDGGVYGDDISLLYALTQELTDLVTLVDGVPRSDLTGLADGVHTLTIQGRDAQGNLVSKTVTFTIDRSIFSLSLLSPQSRLYENNSISIDYAASKTVKRAWYKLNGGADQTNMMLSNLADGDYSLVLYAESDTGTITSVTTNFSVKLGLPSLQVISPVAGKVFSDTQIKVTFSSDSPVSYELGEQTGTLSSGDTLVVPGDGNYSLILSATHPVSGNVITEIVPFSVDSLPLDLSLQSPQAILYAHNDISIDYTANKPLSKLSMSLDGSEVTSLAALSSGQHSFVLTAEDSAGRQIEKQVQFTVTNLDIVDPQDGSVIVSNTSPPVLPFKYSAGQELSVFAYSLDTGPKQLLTQQPGTVIPLAIAPGKHEIRLQGSVNEFTVGKRSQFEIGAKNISVGPGSIDYYYDNCDAAGVYCDLNVTLKISNSGDLDVVDPIRVRFDHIADIGFQTQEQIVNSLAKDADVSLTMAPIRARIGDALIVTVDPLAELNAEWLDDNLHQIKFETGQITDVKSSMAFSNSFLQGVNLFNTVDVTTAGPVASVEVQMNGWTFIDNDASNGFSVLTDMGLLTSENNCVQVIARSSAQVALDVSSLCANVSKLALQDATPLKFPWDAFTSNANTVITSTLDVTAVAVALAESRLNTFKQPASVNATLDETGQLKYQLMADPAAVQEQSYTKAFNMGSAPIVGGNKQLPNGHGLFVSSLDITNQTCNVVGSVPIVTHSLDGDFDDMSQEELDGINSLANLGSIDDILEERGQFNALEMQSLNLPIFRMFPTLGLSVFDLAGIDLYATFMRGENYSFVGFIGNTIPEQLAYVDLNGGYEVGFFSDSDGCLIVDDTYNNEVSLSFNASYRVSIDADIDLTTSGGQFSILGLASYDHNGIPIAAFLPATAVVTVGDVRLYTQNINIPFSLDVGVDMAVVDQRLYFGPANASFDVSVKHSARLADGDVVGYPLFLFGFGGGVEYKADIALKGTGKADAGAGNHSTFDSPSSYQFYNTDFKGKLVVQKRDVYCFLGACHRRSWKIDSIPYDEIIEDGAAYTADEVQDANDLLEPFDFGELNDLTSMGLYAFITGDTQLATDYLSCGVYQNLTENLPNVPIYSDRTGQCALVTNPDYKPLGVASYYSDAACSTPMSYTPTPFLEFCQNNLLEANRLYTGNSAAWPDSGVDSSRGIKSTEWTLAHGPTIDVVAASPQGNSRPFMKQAEYRVVDGCHLEMRIFKKNAQATNLKPMMFIHGGAWKYRGLGAIGMEAMISHFTERDYVVFAPYYRLMGDSVGPVECHIPPGTDNIAPGEKIVVDIEAALDWVKANGDVFGAANSPVTLVGQSAGAHLSGWLSTHRSADVRQSLLFYPPTDIEYMVQEGQPGGLYGSTFDGGKRLVAQFLNYETFGDIDPANLSPFVQENGFPDLARQGIDHPPTFMIHGNADSLVPVEMSARQCDALAGAPYTTTSTSGGIYSCGNQRGKESRLHIIDGAEHILDLKCFADPSILAFLGNSEAGYKLCPSGSLVNEALVKASIDQALQWLQ